MRNLQRKAAEFWGETTPLTLFRSLSLSIPTVDNSPPEKSRSYSSLTESWILNPLLNDIYDLRKGNLPDLRVDTFTRRL